MFRRLSAVVTVLTVLGGGYAFAEEAAGPAVVYGAASVGGLTMFERTGLGVNDDTNFLVGNVGGGVKWYAHNILWGLRADYRFLMTKSSTTAPSFFGQDNRYGHRLYTGVIINAAR